MNDQPENAPENVVPFEWASIEIIGGSITAQQGASGMVIASTVRGRCSKCGRTFEGSAESLIFHVADHAEGKA